MDEPADLRTLAASGVPKVQMARDFEISRDTVYEYPRPRAKEQA